MQKKTTKKNKKKQTNRTQDNTEN